MKTHIFRMIALMLALIFLVSCQRGTPEAGGNETTGKQDETTVKDDATTTKPDGLTTETPSNPPDASVTNPPVTNAPVTEPPATEPPVTDPPETEPPIVYTEGLAFTPLYGNTYAVTGRGTARATEIYIPPTYNGGEVTEIAEEAFKDAPMSASLIQWNRLADMPFPVATVWKRLISGKGCRSSLFALLSIVLR